VVCSRPSCRASGVTASHDPRSEPSFDFDVCDVCVVVSSPDGVQVEELMRSLTVTHSGLNSMHVSTATRSSMLYRSRVIASLDSALRQSTNTISAMMVHSLVLFLSCFVRGILGHIDEGQTTHRTTKTSTVNRLHYIDRLTPIHDYVKWLYTARLEYHKRLTMIIASFASLCRYFKCFCILCTQVTIT